jgi:hypothetical protein
MVEIFLFENDETILRSGPLDKQSIIDKEKIIRKYFPYEVKVRHDKLIEVYAYCEEQFGFRFFDGMYPYNDINLIALWEWYGGPLFRTEEAAVMFKLGFIEL